MLDFSHHSKLVAAGEFNRFPIEIMEHGLINVCNTAYGTSCTVRLDFDVAQPNHSRFQGEAGRGQRLKVNCYYI